MQFFFEKTRSLGCLPQVYGSNPNIPEPAHDCFLLYWKIFLERCIVVHVHTRARGGGEHMVHPPSNSAIP